LKDLQGQATEAFSKSDYYKKWGVHYLPSLINAHLLQMCNNFKDPGVQVYGGKLFGKLRDKADDTFVKLPPPKPSIHTAAPVKSMHTYHSSSNPCFHGNCVAEMVNGQMKKLKDLNKGDRVMSWNSKSVEIECVIKTACANERTHLVELPGGLLVTPYHPVNIDGEQWQFPCMLGDVKDRECPAIYSFVLKDEHVMMINGTACVTLGHNFQEDVVRHSYFGSQRVIEDLKKINGWKSGRINLEPNCLVRDVDSGSRVCAIRSN